MNKGKNEFEITLTSKLYRRDRRDRGRFSEGTGDGSLS